MAWKFFGFKQWQDPDYRVRLEFAQRTKNQSKLLKLALNDVHESVRVAAVKNLRSDSDRIAVIECSGCDRSLSIAVGMLQSDGALVRAAGIKDLDSDLRLDALERVSGRCGELLLELVLDPSEKLALYAIYRCEAIERLEDLYSEELSEDRGLAIIEKSCSEAFFVQVFENSLSLPRRLAALGKISDTSKLREFYLNEHDSEVRALVVEQCNDDAILMEFFNDEDDERIRMKIAEKVGDEDWLFSVACQDYNISVRRAAAQAIDEPAKLIQVAIQNDDRAIHDIVLGENLADEHFSQLAFQSSASYVRVKAISSIKDLSILTRLLDESKAPEVIWFAGRRLGKLPIAALRQIQSAEVLVRAAEQDSHKIARIAAIRQIKDEWALERLSKSDNVEVAETAQALRREVQTNSGLSFLQVPNRNYQMSVFPVTGEQFARWKAAIGDQDTAAKYATLQDFPATDVSVEEAKAYCAWLCTNDNARYRLPYFHEWKHAALSGEADWFSTGRMRAFSSQEEVELVLFGKERCARSIYEAVPNPWGFLDTIGNVLEWTCDVPYSEQMLRAGITVDEFAATEGDEGEALDLNDFAYASGNHWGDRRIRAGRWKRLINKKNLNGSAAGKIGFRVLRFDSEAKTKPVEYELTLLPDVAFGYTLDQVCWSVSQSLSISYEEAKKHFTVAPYRLAILRDYGAILRLKESWESVGALTEIKSKPIDGLMEANA